MSVPRTGRLGRPSKSAKAITKGQIYQTAFDLIEIGGLEALTFRALAKPLDVTPMAIKHHAGTRKQLLFALATLAFSEICDPAEGNSPLARLHFLLDRYCECAISNPHLICAMLADMTLIGDKLTIFTDQVRQELVAILDGDSVLPVLNLIIDYTHGFVFSIAAAPVGQGPSREEYRASLDWVLRHSIP